MAFKEFYAERRNAGKLTDPETAYVFVRHGYVIDPYGVMEDIPFFSGRTGPSVALKNGVDRPG